MCVSSYDEKAVATGASCKVLWHLGHVKKGKGTREREGERMERRESESTKK